MLTRILIAINAIAFFWELQTGAFDDTGGSLVRHGAIYGPAIFVQHQYWRIVTGAFLHGGWLHIGANMFALWQVGSFVEALMGARRMALVYFLSAIVAGFAAAYVNYGDPVVGASGAIFGLFGALVAIGMRLGRRGRSLIAQAVPIIALNLFPGFSIPQVANSAHIGGLVAGFFPGLLFYRAPRVVSESP